MEISAVSAITTTSGSSSVSATATTTRTELTSAVSYLPAPSEPRLLMVKISPAAHAEIGRGLITLHDAHQAGMSNGLTATVDRLRADFESIRQRLAGTGTNTSITSALSGQSPVAQLEAVMQQSIRDQAEIFKVAVSFNAGLTASQQSQSGVKTLIEKS